VDHRPEEGAWDPWRQRLRRRCWRCGAPPSSPAGVAEVEEGGEQREERGDVSDGVEALVEALDDVSDEVGVRDQGADLGEGIGCNLLAVEVVADREVPLFDVAEFLDEVNHASLLVVVEEAMDGHPHHVGDSNGGVGGSRGRHDDV
jgi:hypothetical protein